MHFSCHYRCGKFVTIPFDQTMEISIVVAENHLFIFVFERFPFVTNNLIGYSIAALLQFIMNKYAYHIIACTLSLGIGAFLSAISVTKAIRRMLHKIHDKTEGNECQTIKLKRLLSEFICAHAVAKKLSKLFILESHISNLI